MANSLTNTECQKAKPRAAKYRLFDGRGLYLEVMPNGSKYWRLKYYYLKKERLLALGIYPSVGLAEARKKRDDAKKLLAEGIDPSEDKKQKERKAVINAGNTFEAVCKEWLELNKERWSGTYYDNISKRLELNVLPHIGNRPIANIDAPELLLMLKKIEKRGAYYLSNRIKQECGQIFRYGIATGRGTRDHAADLKGALKTKTTEHFAAIDHKELPNFLNILRRNDARLYARTKRGIELLMLTFVRTNELIKATWVEIDFDNKVWEIPAERMKMKKPHIVPLSEQAILLLKAQKEETESFKTSPWVFPSQIKPREHMSNATILNAIKRLGFNGKMTGHGFRALAMTTIKEKLGYRHEVVDRQLAHAAGSMVDRAYDRAQFLDERTVMMQRWADYIDQLAAQKDKVVDLQKVV